MINSDLNDAIYIGRSENEAYTALKYNIDENNAIDLRINESGLVSVVHYINGAWQKEEQYLNDEYIRGISNNIAYDSNNNIIPCHGTMIKKFNNTCDIHLSFNIKTMNNKIDIPQAFSKTALCSMFGVNNIQWDAFNTKVAIINCRSALDNELLSPYLGNSGLMFATDNDLVGFARWYDGTSTLGYWFTSSELYSTEISYNVDIYGAVYS